MKTIINFLKRAVEAYCRETAKTYSWMYTGCTYIISPKDEETAESNQE